MRFNWLNEIDKFNYEVKELDIRNIKLMRKEHLEGISYKISKTSIREYLKKEEDTVKIVVRPIENTDDYELLIG